MLIVAFQFGWGLLINEDQLKDINDSRNGINYFDTTAATEVNRISKKTKLSESPFIHKFEFGGDNGCWTENHMTPGGVLHQLPPLILPQSVHLCLSVSSQ
jgi:hypothetical protein